MFLSAVNFFLYISHVQCANILGVFVFPSISHQIVYQPIWRELSLRGHNVTVVTPDPLEDPTLTNLTEISVRFTYEILKGHKLEKVFSKNSNAFKNLYTILRLLDIIVEAELNSTHFKELIADQSKQFDLILIEYFHPLMYAVARRFEAPIIGVSSFGLISTAYDTIGNPSHPVLYPEYLLGFRNKGLSLWQKIRSVLFAMWTRYHHNNIFLPRAHEMAKKYFGDDVSYIGDLERNVSMLLLNVNPPMFPSRPNVPALGEMGQMHIKPVQPLPKDLQTLLDEAREGVIYFSLGTNIRCVDISEKLRKVIIEAFSELPYKIIWRWESDDLPGKPSNVIIRKWLPQQDLLAHSNIKAFVMQGGLQSIEEAISRAVPLIGMPFIVDQPVNVQRIVDMGIGLEVDPVTVNKEELKKNILEVAEDSRYKKRIEEVRDLLFDKPMTGLEKVVWWSEYVIRHKGARHWRSPTTDISWFHYLLLDVLLTVFLTTGIFIFLSYKVVQLANTYRNERLNTL